MDNMSYRLYYKKKDARKKYYHCSHKDDLQVPVKVTLDIASDMITGVRGDHNHDNKLDGFRSQEDYQEQCSPSFSESNCQQ